MREYELNDTIYIDISDIRTEYKSTYCRGIRSNNQLLERKNITDYVYGRIINDRLTITEKLSKKLGSIYINKSVLGELFETKEDTIPSAPPLIEDKDLVFFKDDNGREYSVPMRGTRTKDGIYFQVKAIMRLFEMPTLNNDMKHANSGFKPTEHYTYFNISCTGEIQHKTDKQQKEMFITYTGLRQIIDRSRSTIARTFKKWIDEIVFSALWGTKEQKIETFKKVLNVDADHLKAIMSKSPTAITCLYLIDIGIADNGKKVFKYGLTNDASRRFREHMKHYGDHIKMDTFILVPAVSLSAAEAEFKKSVSRYQYTKDSEQELISVCDEAYRNVKTIFKTISDKYTGNISNQLLVFEMQMNELKMENLKLSMTIDLKNKDIDLKNRDIELRDKEIEILQLKLQLAQK